MAGQGQRVQRQRAAGRNQASPQPRPTAGSNGQPLSGAQVLCVDNEESILIGMRQPAERAGAAKCGRATDQAQCAALLAEGRAPQLALVDYHLDHGETGTELMGWLARALGGADSRRGDQCRRPSGDGCRGACRAGLDYLAKPVKPAALRALLKSTLTS